MIGPECFDREARRKGTSCIKWDFQAGDCGREGLLPFFIADADWPTAPGVVEALRRRVEHGVFGYTDAEDGYYEAVVRWFQKRHSLSIQREWIVPTAGIVPSISLAVMLFTDPGAGVVVQPPVYDPFYSVVEANGRKVLCNDLLLRDGRYEMDYGDLEAKLRAGAQMLILCSPHNPVGRVWTREELERCAGLCAQYGAILVSDEIHCDLTMEGVSHFSAGRLDCIRDRLVLCTAPSKSFNIAGLQTSNIIIPSRELREKYQGWLCARYQFTPNALGLVACRAAYETGEEWMDAQRAYLTANYRYLADFFQREIPLGKVADTQGTYLVWVDLTALGKTSEALVVELAKRGAAVNGGRHYGEHYDGFIRVNIACPRAQLREGLAIIARTVRECAP